MQLYVATRPITEPRLSLAAGDILPTKFSSPAVLPFLREKYGDDIVKPVESSGSYVVTVKIDEPKLKLNPGDSLPKKYQANGAIAQLREKYGANSVKLSEPVNFDSAYQARIAELQARNQELEERIGGLEIELRNRRRTGTERK